MYTLRLFVCVCVRAHVFLPVQCIPIDGRTIATGKLPASSSNICSVSAFVNVYVFGRLPIKDGVNCNENDFETFFLTLFDQLTAYIGLIRTNLI